MLVQTINIKTTATGQLLLDIPTTYLEKDLEVVLVIQETQKRYIMITKIIPPTAASPNPT